MPDIRTTSNEPGAPARRHGGDEVRQPIVKPATIDEYLAVRHALIDTHRRPLVVVPCAHCGREHFTVEPCAHEVPCPTCGSTASRGRRPSDHDAAAWHTERVNALEALCAQREAAGSPQAARWPEPGDARRGPPHDSAP